MKRSTSLRQNLPIRLEKWKVTDQKQHLNETTSRFKILTFQS